jgi:hypothetical protein
MGDAESGPIRLSFNPQLRVATRFGRALGMLLIIASLLQGCLGLVIADQELKTARVEKAIRARAVDDPGPIITVAMIPLGGSPAEPVKPRQTDSFNCEVHARLTTTGAVVDVSKASLVTAATERYVLCMTGRGYRCADNSKHKACGNAWAHPTATREQWLEDLQECKRHYWTTFALASTLWARYLECMRSKGYRPDVGEVGERRP